MKKTEKGNETCAISWHRDTIENLIATRARLWTKRCPSSTPQRPHSPKSTLDWLFGDGKRSLIIPIGRNDEHVDFSSCFRLAFITLRLRMLRACRSNGTDMSPIRYSRIWSNNWLLIDICTSRIVLMITRRMWSIIISSYNRGISKHGQTFSKNKKFLVTLTNIFGHPPKC